MYKLCKTEQSVARQREMEEGLLKFMAVRRYEDITVSDFCEFLQIPRKSFYRYFSSKEGALYALLDHKIMDYTMETVRMKGSDPQMLYHVLERFFTFWQGQQELLDVLANSGLSSLLLIRCIVQAHDINVLPARQMQAVTFATTGLMTMMIGWHHAGFKETVSELAHTAYKLLAIPLAEQMG